MSQDQVTELAELMSKIAPEAVKIPGLEKKVGEMQGLIDGLRKSAESSKAEAKPNEQEGKGERRITAPEIALDHYTKCDKCKPKLAKWLTDNGYEKYEPEAEPTRGLGF